MSDEQPQDLGVNLNLSPGQFDLNTGGEPLRIKPLGMSSPTNPGGQGPRGMVKGDYVQPHNGQYASGWHDPDIGLVPGDDAG